MKKIKRPVKETENQTYFTVRSPESDDKDIYTDEVVATEILKRGYTPEMSDEEALDLAWDVVKDRYGIKHARYFFLVDKDFKSDVLRALQRKYRKQIYSRSGIMETILVNESIEPYLNEGQREVHFLMSGEKYGTYQISDKDKNPILEGTRDEIERILSSSSDMGMIEIRNVLSSIDKGKRYQMVMLSPMKLSAI